MVERPIASEEFTPVSGPAHLTAGKIGKRDAMRRFHPPRILREHRSRLWIDLSPDERSGDVTRSSEHPLYVRSNREPSVSA